MRWEIAFADPAVRARATRVIAEVHRGSCLDRGEVVYREEIAIGAMAPAVPTLAGGVFAFSAIARDASCIEIARGCDEVVLPGDPGVVVRTVLTETRETEPICAACSAGACEAPPDGGAVP